MQEKMKNYWNNVYIILMILIVVGHSISDYASNSTFYKSIFLFLWAFQIPLFYFLSALNHENKNILKKMVCCFGLYVILKTILYFVAISLGKTTSYSLFSDSGIASYVFSLGCYIGVSKFINDKNNKRILLISVIVACISGYFAQIGDFLVLSRSIIYFPFYLLGLIIKKEQVYQASNSKFIRYAGLVVFVLWGITCFSMLDEMYFLRPLFTARNAYSARIKVFGPAFRIICYGTSILVGFSLLCLITDKNVFSEIDGRKKVIIVFLLHQIILKMINYLGVWKNYVSKSILLKALWPVLSIGLTIVIFLIPYDFISKTIYNFCYGETDKKVCHE